jgi:hypothetical protein
MDKSIKDIWIESEQKGPIIGGQQFVDDNSDVIITFSDNSKYVATFFTYDNIKSLRTKNEKTGECLSGKYFWASDMVLIDRIERKDIIEVIEELIKTKEFEQTFKKIE